MSARHPGPPLVLIVDDNSGDVELVKTAFEDAGVDARFETASDGADALERLDRGAAGDDPPDVILLDLRLPKVSGHQVLGRIQGDPALREIPTLILSTSSSPIDKALALASGARDYVVKPSRLEEFDDVIARIKPWLKS